MPRSRRVIGVDESGKGDFFGPLVVAAFLADDSETETLRSMGVRDGKLISEKKILEIDERLRGLYPHALVVLEPAEYNRLHQRIKNLNKLLAEGHAEAIKQVLMAHRADLAVSDKFGKPELTEDALRNKGGKVELQQIVRGESIVQVAAASILARARFLREMEQLAVKHNVTLPRGAGPIVDRAARQIVAGRGAALLTQLAKTHFKNYLRVVNPTIFAD